MIMDQSDAAKKKGGGKSTKKKKDKDKDKPKRPLSAYNLFFQAEREKILQSVPEPVQGKPRRSHGKIGFAPLARAIAERWNTLDNATRNYFEERAAMDKIRYNQEFAAWELRQSSTATGAGVEGEQQQSGNSSGNGPASSTTNSDLLDTKLPAIQPNTGSSGRPEASTTTSNFSSELMPPRNLMIQPRVPPEQVYIQPRATPPARNTLLGNQRQQFPFSYPSTSQESAGGLGAGSNIHCERSHDVVQLPSFYLGATVGQTAAGRGDNSMIEDEFPSTNQQGGHQRQQGDSGGGAPHQNIVPSFASRPRNPESSSLFLGGTAVGDTASSNSAQRATTGQEEGESSSSSIAQLASNLDNESIDILSNLFNMKQSKSDQSDSS